jgi:hypothetical protein
MNLAKHMISGYKGTRKRKYVVNIDIDGLISLGSQLVEKPKTFWQYLKGKKTESSGTYNVN